MKDQNEKLKILNQQIKNVQANQRVQDTLVNQQLPLHQSSSSKIAILSVDEAKRSAVKAAIQHAFNGYATLCFGQDEVNADSGMCENWLNQGNTIIDSMDTLWIVGLHEEFKRGRDWIANNLVFKAGSISFFETTIRVLGGLLTMFELSKDQIFLSKAQELGEKLLPAFNTNSGLPRSQIDLVTGKSANPQWNGGASLVAEVGTIQLEFATLARYTKREEFSIKSRRIFESLNSMKKPFPGLYPIFINVEGNQVSLFFHFNFILARVCKQFDYSWCNGR